MREFFTERIGLKLISLLIAGLLEVYLYSPENSVTATVSAHVDVINIPGNQIIVSPPNGDRGLFAQVTVRGPSPLVEQAKEATSRFLVEIPNDPPPNYVTTLNTQQLKLPLGLRILHVDPARIEFQFEPVVRKELPVIADLIGKPAPGFQLTTTSVNPVSIFAQGPVSELGGKSGLRTQRIDLSGLSDSQLFEVALLDPGRLTTLSQDKVSVNVEIVPESAERTLEKVILRILAPDGYATIVEPSKMAVTLRGPVATLSSLNVADIEVLIDARARAEGKWEVEPTFSLPTGISVVKTHPRAANVTVARKRG